MFEVKRSRRSPGSSAGSSRWSQVQCGETGAGQGKSTLSASSAIMRPSMALGAMLGYLFANLSKGSGWERRASPGVTPIHRL